MQTTGVNFITYLYLSCNVNLEFKSTPMKRDVNENNYYFNFALAV